MASCQNLPNSSPGWPCSSDKSVDLTPAIRRSPCFSSSRETAIPIGEEAHVTSQTRGWLWEGKCGVVAAALIANVSQSTSSARKSLFKLILLPTDFSKPHSSVLHDRRTEYIRHGKDQIVFELRREIQATGAATLKTAQEGLAEQAN